MPTPLTLNPHRHTILQTLWEYKHLTTQQIHAQALPHLGFSSTWAHLNTLRRMEMVTSHRATPDAGNRSALYWLLTKKGAEAIAHGAHYGSHYRRRPEQERLAQRDVELAFERNIRAAGWQVLKPVTYSRTHPRPTFAQMVKGTVPEQARTLIAVIKESEGRAIRELQQRDPHHPDLAWRIGEYNAKSYCSTVYAAAPNDYLAYVTGATARANIMILCRADVTERFWLKRIRQYTPLLDYVKIFAVFANEAQASSHRPTLKGSGFEIRTVSALGKGGQNGGEGRTESG